MSAQGGYYGNALEAAAYNFGKGTVELLLIEKGANNNPPDSYFHPGLPAGLRLELKGKF